VSNVPSQTLAALWGSRISAAHLPHGLCLTPLYLLLLSPVSSQDTFSLDGVAGTVVVVVVAKLFVASSVTVKGNKTYMYLSWMWKTT
jgi:hypothetical protein